MKVHTDKDKIVEQLRGIDEEIGDMGHTILVLVSLLLFVIAQFVLVISTAIWNRDSLMAIAILYNSLVFDVILGLLLVAYYFIQRKPANKEM
jgi:hypothetical protein